MTPARTDIHSTKGVTLVALLAGLWLFISPWVYSASGYPSAWNDWIIGALIFLVGVIRMNHSAATGLSWFNAILGIWTFASPWVYGYTGSPGRPVSALIVGVIVFCAGIIGANAERMNHDTMSTST